MSSCRDTTMHGVVTGASRGALVTASTLEPPEATGTILELGNAFTCADNRKRKCGTTRKLLQRTPESENIEVWRCKLAPDWLVAASCLYAVIKRGPSGSLTADSCCLNQGLHPSDPRLCHISRAALMEPELSDRYDHALLGILQHVGNIQDFLNVYFGFLYRKTDFYRLLLSPQDRMGFPPGTAQNMVLQAFKTYERLAMQDHEQRVQSLQEKLRKKEERLSENSNAPLSENSNAPGAAEEVVVEASAEAVPVNPDVPIAPDPQEIAEASGNNTEDSASEPQ
ncbi:unnamed protein product [Ranitomeya imitator]|uniref:NudC N-terminal domain-containing protein n=1 Tax=Ranitomeya imitator TaxID=111125 RepID=A0ABN9LH36_9NEOB|nr:unnamed protein product [Ranitomeya imitator]